MRALIVDDEPLARRELRRLLERIPAIDIVGEARYVEEARAQIDALSPELVFLDIEMPDGSGFDVLARIHHMPHVIFTTAYEQHAVRAFEVNALDYLLKPIEPERLEMALARAEWQPSDERHELLPKARYGGVPHRIFVRDGARCWFIPLHEVRLVVSEGNYVRFLWGDAQPMLARSLTSMEQRLASARFFRANRKELMNLDFVENVELEMGGRLLVHLRGGPAVEVSRRQARAFRQRMQM
ncbi:MAG TPA: response regulator [Polyangiaceae bacterium]|nr:response regulator [Polyangiaceae bacterium]